MRLSLLALILISLFSEDLNAKNIHYITVSDVNVWEEGFYSAVFETVDNSGNKSKSFTLYVDVDYDYFPLKGSVADLSLENLLSISPNPTTGLFTINVNVPENENIALSIYNSIGQVIKNINSDEISNDTYTVDISNQANGIYYVQMNIAGNVITEKVVLNR